MSSFMPCKPLLNRGQICQAQQHLRNDWSTRAGNTSRIWNVSRIETRRKSSSTIVLKNNYHTVGGGRETPLKRPIFAILLNPQSMQLKFCILLTGSESNELNPPSSHI